MKPLRVLIADDEPLAREGLALLLQGETGCELAGVCADGKGALEFIRRERPDIAFLDVRMPGLDGVEVSARLGPAERPAIVFVTAFDCYAVRAFELCAVDYLLKPFRDERFKTAFARAREQVVRADFADVQRRVNELASRLRTFDFSSAPTANLRLAVKSGAEHVFLSPADVVWLEARHDRVKIKAGATLHETRESLGALEQRLDPRIFLRVHRAFIVNARRVTRVTPVHYGDHQLEMDDGTRIPMSRTHHDHLPRLIAASSG